MPQDPALAFDAALAQVDPDARLAALKQSLTQWLLTDPTQAMKAVARVPVELRDAVVTSALAALAGERPAQALSALASVTESYATYASAVLEVIVKTDPELALRWALQNTDRDPRGEMIRAIVPSLTPGQLEQVTRIVGTLGDRAPLSLIQQVAAEVAVHDPQRAYAWAAGYSQSRQSEVNEIVDGISVALAARDIDRAAALLDETADPRIRASLIRQVVNRKSESSLHEAWSWLSQYRSDASYGESARNLLYRWAYLRPEEVADLLHDVSDGEMRASVARELASQWRRRDDSAFQAWVASLPPGTMKSAVLDGSGS